MCGYRVYRRGGWDTRLLVEVEIEKEIGSTNKQDIGKIWERPNLTSAVSWYVGIQDWNDPTER